MGGFRRRAESRNALQAARVHPMTSALILFAHGARDPEWAAPLRRVRHAISLRRPEAAVELAFLEFMAPTLPACVADLVARGASRITVLPMFIAQGGHLKRDVPDLIHVLGAQYPGLDLRLATAIGETDSVIAAMAEAAGALL